MRRRFPSFVREWLTTTLPPDPGPASLPPATPAMSLPWTENGEIRITWVGHATALLQLPGLNVLTDPVWGDRAGPWGRWGPRRFVPPVPELDHLPPIHVVLLSHDHFDHLDDYTVRALQEREGPDLLWCTPLGYRSWLSRRGARRVEERDWWGTVVLPEGRGEATAVPARHWTRRTPLGTNRRLWSGWVVRGGNGDGILFAGDSGHCSAFREIGRELGPFRASLLPIGAYAPRWFMGPAHMSPEEAVRAYGELGGRGSFIGIHWGTFRLTFEDPLEPPRLARAAWRAAGYPEADLRIPKRGETVTVGAP